MGDRSAVDLAMRAHEEVLSTAAASEAGAYPVSCRVSSRQPYPDVTLTKYAEQLVIDDRFGIAAVAPHDGAGGRTAKRSFRAASAAYSGGGLDENFSKAVRDAKNGLGLGFEVDGDRGLAGFERTRRLAQSVTSTQVALSGLTTGGLLRRLTSTWTHVFR